MGNNAFINSLNINDEIFDKETICKNIVDVTYEEKKNIINLMQACPSSWKNFDSDELKPNQYKQQGLLGLAGLFLLKCTCVIKDEYYNLNHKIVFEYTGQSGQRKVVNEIVHRLTVKSINKAEEFREQGCFFPNLHPKYKETLWMLSSKGAEFLNIINKVENNEFLCPLISTDKALVLFNMINELQNKEFIYYIWYILFPSQRPIYPGYGRIISIIDLNNHSEQLKKTTPRIKHQWVPTALNITQKDNCRIERGEQPKLYNLNQLSKVCEISRLAIKNYFTEYPSSELRTAWKYRGIRRE